MNPRDITQWVAERSRARRRGSEVSAEDWISKALQENPVLEPVLVTVDEWDQSIRMWERGEQR